MSTYKTDFQTRSAWFLDFSFGCIMSWLAPFPCLQLQPGPCPFLESHSGLQPTVFKCRMFSQTSRPLPQPPAARNTLPPSSTPILLLGLPPLRHHCQSFPCSIPLTSQGSCHRTSSLFVQGLDYFTTPGGCPVHCYTRLRAA